MGLNLETLIFILAILVLLIVADGLRRVWRDRRGRLKMKIDRRLIDQFPEDDNEPVNRDIIGPTRITRLDGSAEDDGDEPHEIGDDHADHVSNEAHSAVSESPNNDVESEDLPVFSAKQTDQAPPVVMESAQKIKPALNPKQQQDMFSPVQENTVQQSGATESATEKTANANTGTSSATTNTDKSVAQSESNGLPSEVVVLHLLARTDAPFPGRDLLGRLLERGLRYGEMNIFHCHQNNDGIDELQFSLSNAFQPGTFDLENMSKESFKGVTLFMEMPGPSKPSATLEKLLSTAKALASALDGDLLDDQRSVLTSQSIEHLRQRVQDFERKQRLHRA